jgi:hypothetical protein
LSSSKGKPAFVQYKVGLRRGEGGVYLKKSEPILLTGSAGGIPTEPPLRPPRQKAEAERQTVKEPEKMSARTLFWPETGFLLFYFPCLILIYLLSLY